MKQMKKKALSLGLMLAMLVMLLPGSLGGLTVYATSCSQDEAINWVKSQVGQALDMDGKYGAQCVDLILAYYDFLGVPRSSGNGTDYTHNTLPAGWQRIQGAQAQRGDILVYAGTSGNPYGHVAIYESDRVTYHQNFDFGSGPDGHVRVVTYRYNSFGNYWGVIRPDWSGAGSLVNLGDDFYAKVLHTASARPLTNTKIPIDEGNQFWFNIDIRTDSGEPNQIWHFTRQSDGAYVITSCDGYNKVWDVGDASRNAGANVQGLTYTGHDAQKWYIYGSQGGYHLRAKCTSCYLDITGGATADGTNVEMWTPNDSSAQNFTINKIIIGKSTVSVNPGDTDTATSFTWTKADNATHYSLRVWNRNKLGNDQDFSTFYIKNTSYSLKLAPGYYDGYVDSCNSYTKQYAGSNNTISFVVKPKLRLQKQTNGTFTFTYDKVLSASEYELIVLKQGDDGKYTTYTTKTVTDDCSFQASAGKYQARIKAYFSEPFQPANGGSAVSYVLSDNVSLSYATLSSVTVKKKPAKLTYKVGESFDSTGMILKATYSDGTTKEITSGFTCTPAKMTTAGEQKINVSYGGKNTGFPVTVTANATVKQIRVTQRPTKTTYVVGETLNTAGMKVTVTYSDDTTQVITSGFVCTPTKLETAGTQWITVKYGGTATATPVTVNASAKTVSAVTIAKKPTKQTYTVGETFAPAGMKLKVTYTDNTTSEITSGFTYTPTGKFTTTGQQKIVVSYGGKSTGFYVTVNQAAKAVSSVTIAKKPAKQTYTIGESFNSAGMKLKVTYTDSTTAEITSGFTYTPTGSLNTAGQQKIVVSYGGKSTGFYVTVNKAVSTVTIAKKPTKLTYTVGEYFNASGMKLKVTYTDGTTAELTDGFTWSPSGQLTTAGQQKIVVAYGGKATGFYVTVQ